MVLGGSSFPIITANINQHWQHAPRPSLAPHSLLTSCLVAYLYFLLAYLIPIYILPIPIKHIYITHLQYSYMDGSCDASNLLAMHYPQATALHTVINQSVHQPITSNRRTDDSKRGTIATLWPARNPAHDTCPTHLPNWTCLGQVSGSLAN